MNRGVPAPTLPRLVQLLIDRQRYVEADRVIRRLEQQQTPFSADLGRVASELSLPSSCSAAIFRMSSVIFIEQYLGPHMLQKWALLKVSWGRVSS